MVTTVTVSLLAAIAFELDSRIAATCSGVMILYLGGKEKIKTKKEVSNYTNPN